MIFGWRSRYCSKNQLRFLTGKVSWEGLERNIKTYTNLSPDTGASLPFPSAQESVGAYEDVLV
jgi:hypothetical protein